MTAAAATERARARDHRESVMRWLSEVLALDLVPVT
jgi:hypothetical protein